MIRISKVGLPIIHERARHRPLACVRAGGKRFRLLSEKLTKVRQYSSTPLLVVVIGEILMNVGPASFVGQHAIERTAH